MRLQLRRARRSGACAALAAAILLVASPAAPLHAEDRITVRGAYYREASTRVIQPVVQISKDLPNGFDITAQYLLDAITSASVAAGTASDTIFTELRNEVGLGIGKTWNRWRSTLGYVYSAESDYWAHSIFGSTAYRFWGDSATIGASAGIGFAGAWPRNRTPDCPTAVSEMICKLRQYFGSVGYTQVWSPTLVTYVGGELEYLDGFQASLYRAVPNHGFEVVPSTRWRDIATARVAYYVPDSSTGFQLQYRYYHDSWDIDAHMIEGRVFQALTPDLEVRASYRYYTQTPSYFWCDWMAMPGCYGVNATLYTSDPKLQHVHTSMPEVKLTWDAYRLRGVPFLGWFSEGSLSVSYAYFIQNTSFGNAHLLQMGYTLPY
jgi:hypothetical protein